MYTDEERKRRSVLAKELVAQGKFGGANRGQGRPRKKRASELVAEAAEADARHIIAAFRSGLDPAQPATVRVNTAREYLQVERHERELQLKEDKQLEEMSQNELLEDVARMLGKARASGINFDMDLEAQEQDELEAASGDEGDDD